MRAERHPDEAARLEALRAYEILDSPPEAEFDDLVALASRICETPIALVSLVDAERQWFKATAGLDLREMPFEVSLCAHAILQGGLVEVPDLAADPRFSDNPVVAAEPHARFYAGMTLDGPEGLPLGTLCVIDTKPRALTDLQREALRVLGRQAMAQMELRRRVRQGEKDRRSVQETLAQAEIATWRFNVATGLVSGNPLAEIFYNVLGAVPIESIVEAIHPDDRARRAAAHAEAIRAGGTYEVEYRTTGSDGVERWLLARGEASRDDSGGSRFLSGVAIDITGRRRAELALEGAQKETDATLEFAGVATWAWHAGSDHMQTNRLLRRFFGVPSEETGDLTLFDFLKSIYPDDRERVSAEIAGAMEGSRFESEYRVIDGEGTERWVLARGRLVGGLTLAGVLVDVTDRRRTQEALRRSEDRFRAAQETTPDAFTIIEAVREESGEIVDFRWTYVNPATERLTGEPQEALLGSSFNAMRPQLRNGPLFRAYVGVVETGEPATLEFPITYGERSVFLRLTAVRVGDGVAVSFNDITDRRRTEEQLREAVEARTKELREAVEEAERFNYSISHDLRTPLRAISATSQMLLEEAGPELDESHRELLERQNHNARRLGLLIDQLLRLSRLGMVEMARSPLDMTAIARSVAEELALAGESPCAIEVQEGMRGEGDAALVRLVFANLIGNACKFSRGEGTVRVGQEGDAFSVSDEGVGFDMRFAPKIFRPFERLVSDGEFPGTGIGLANVERIVRRHGGRVWAESEPGKGATFRFTLG